ncbi:transglutaminase-like domain-containing protein [Flagellimonas algicola]|nr:transglutaminase-like domain-containing protein [Allomuricauda algicola]
MMTTKIFVSILFSLSVVTIIYQGKPTLDKTLESISDSYWITKGNNKFGAYKISEVSHRNVAHIKTSNEGLELRISTDIDSLELLLLPNDTIPIEIYPRERKTPSTIKIIGIPSKPIKHRLSFLDKSKQSKFQYEYPVLTADYMSLLMETYHLEAIQKDAKTDIEILTAVTSWAHRQWNHDGGNVPSKADTHTILQEVAQGKNFRCVEYSIVISELMQALGYQARVLGLKRKECETMLTSAGHAVAEVFLPELNKWVFADGQFNAIPFLDGKPLNAVEFQDALTEDASTQRLQVQNTEIPFEEYAEWVYPYLHYFDFKVQFKDTSVTQNSLMLVPLKERSPKYFQKKWGVGNCLYTSNISDFYAKP